MCWTKRVHANGIYARETEFSQRDDDTDDVSRDGIVVGRVSLALKDVATTTKTIIAIIIMTNARRYYRLARL